MNKLIAFALVATCIATPLLAQEDRSFRLLVDAELETSGLTGYLLPRFALKTGRRAELVDNSPDLTISADAEGDVVLVRDDRVFRLSVSGDNPAAARFVDWLTSDIGQTAIANFVPDEGAVFAAATKEAVVVEIVFEGDAALGAEVAEVHCARCHRVSAKATGIGIGSSPSFPALRALDDWAQKFSVFYALNPHPSFMRVIEISPPFDPARPPPIVPVEMTLKEVEAVQAYVAELEPADLGAPVAHQ